MLVLKPPIDIQDESKTKEDLQKQRQKAMAELRLTPLEATALRNRTGCETAGDFKLLFREFHHIERLADLQILLKDALVSKQRAIEFFNLIRSQIEEEEEAVRNRKKREAEDFFGINMDLPYDDTRLEAKRAPMALSTVYSYLPYWLVPLDEESHLYS